MIIYGEYECRLDERGRLKLPAKLLDSLGGLKSEGFVINRGYEQNLAIYPKRVWELKTKEINQLNIYDKQHRDVIRYFYRGATELLLDASDRVTLPASLMAYACIDRDVILSPLVDAIEVWAKEKYDLSISQEPGNFGLLTQSLLVNKDSDSI